MPIDLDSALGIHAKALQLRSRRAELLAENLANADTPGYKARDIDFRAAMQMQLLKICSRQLLIVDPMREAGIGVMV